MYSFFSASIVVFFYILSATVVNDYVVLSPLSDELVEIPISLLELAKKYSVR